MHEYRLDGDFSIHNLSKNAKNEWVICRVFQKGLDGKKTHISGLARVDSLGNEPGPAGLPPLMDSDKTKLMFAGSSYVSCFSKPVNSQTNQQNTIDYGFNNPRVSSNSFHILPQLPVSNSIYGNAANFQYPSSRREIIDVTRFYMENYKGEGDLNDIVRASGGGPGGSSSCSFSGQATNSTVPPSNWQQFTSDPLNFPSLGSAMEAHNHSLNAFGNPFLLDPLLHELNVAAGSTTYFNSPNSTDHQVDVSSNFTGSTSTAILGQKKLFDEDIPSPRNIFSRIQISPSSISVQEQSMARDLIENHGSNMKKLQGFKMGSSVVSNLEIEKKTRIKEFFHILVKKISDIVARVII